MRWQHECPFRSRRTATAASCLVYERYVRHPNGVSVLSELPRSSCRGFDLVDLLPSWLVAPFMYINIHIQYFERGYMELCSL